MAEPKQRIKTKIPHLTPNQKRLLLLQEEKKQAQAKLKEIRQQIEPIRLKAKKKEESLRRLEEKISGDFRSTSKSSNIVTQEQLEEIPLQIRDDVVEEDLNIVFKPNPGPQTEFLAATEKEVFYGGARGGGKSYSLLVDPLRYCDKTNARALILRRTMPELRDLINHSQRLYDKAFPGAKWREQEKEWRFPSGARIEFGYAETPQDALRYQGQAYTWIGVDELPQFPTPEIWNELKGSLRSVDPNIPEYMRACVDEGDVLTLNGWKPVQNVKIGELVYSLDKNKEIVVKPVTNIYEYDINEELVRYYNKGLYLSITNDHRVVHSKSPRHLTMSIDRYNQINNKRINIYRHGIKYNSCGIDNKILELEPELYLEILGYFLSEGCTTTRNRVIISQKKKESKNIIRACLNKTGLKWLEDSSGFTLHNNLVWYNHFKQFGKSIDKFIPRNILNTVSQDQANILLNALILGDGHRSKFDYIEYYTISKQLWDDVAELAFKACYKVWQRKRERPKYSCNTQYELSIRQNNTPTSELNKANEKLELYKGKVYCISVEETQTFVLRQKGAIMISGNTGNP